MAVVLTSGGIDSTVLLYWMVKLPETFCLRVGGQQKIIALDVDYGQKTYSLTKRFVDYHVAKLDWPIVRESVKINYPLSESLKKSPAFIDTLPERNRSPLHADYMNGWGMLVLTTAAVVASNYGMDLYIGQHWEEPSENPHKVDRDLDFLDAWEYLRDAGGFCASDAPTLLAPYLRMGMAKEDVVNLAVKFDVDLSRTFSCSYSMTGQCGVCKVCLQRESLLRERALSGEILHADI